jgi:hypothetical protein
MRSRALLTSFALVFTACAGAPPAPPPARRPPPVALGAPDALPGPLDVPPGLGPSMLVTRAPGAGHELSFPSIEQGSSRESIAGLFVLGLDSDKAPPPDGGINRYTVRTHGCLLRGNPSCTYLRSGARGPGGAVRWSPFTAISAEYEHVMVGNSAIFLRAADGATDVLAVGPAGQTSAWMAVPKEPTAADSATWLVVDDQPVFAYRIDQEIVLHTRATTGGPPRRVPFRSRFAWLDYETPLGETRALARKGARFAYRLTFTTTEDATGAPEPGLVAAWIEFQLPTTLPKDSGLADEFPWVGLGMKVPRRLHLARISLEGRVTDHVELSPAATRALMTHDDEEHLVPPGSMSAWPVPGGAVIEGGRIDGKLRPKAGGAPDLPQDPAFPLVATEALQHVCAAGYDAAAREGLVVVCEAEVALAQRFDARGALVGAPQELPGALGASLARRGVVRLAEGWVGATRDGGRVVGLSGTVAGLRVEVPHDPDAGAFTTVAARGPEIDLFFVHDPSGAVRRVRVDVASRVAKAPEVLAERVDVASAFVRSLASPRLIADPRGGQWMITKGEEGYRAHHRTPEGRIDVVRDLGKAVSVDLTPVFGDVVAVLLRSAQDDERSGVWLGDGRSAALPNGKPSWTSPVLAVFGGATSLVLPDAAPAAPLSPEVVNALFTCEDVFPTGARSAVLVCTEPPSEQRLGRRVTLRALGIEGKVPHEAAQAGAPAVVSGETGRGGGI